MASSLAILRSRLQTSTSSHTCVDMSLKSRVCYHLSALHLQIRNWKIGNIVKIYVSHFRKNKVRLINCGHFLGYWYGVGPGTDLPSKMMLPFLNSLVGLLAQGPGTQGINKNGSAFTVPSIIAAFLVSDYPGSFVRRFGVSL